ncbi:MAG: precorrin-3B C(17)-methyltransferase [Syntrophaceae bacterium]|nr:precorrin-3B C(17)-methyltransferase [Syntrophaceae bacterium]
MSVISESDVIVGYSRYVDLIRDLIGEKKVVSTGMMRERERCSEALQMASNGFKVSLVSSGDPGVYGMAGLAIELRKSMGISIPIEIVPGVTAASSAAAAMGAPLMLDFAVISLSDLLVPWEMIRQRLEAVANADLVVALYNPRSRKRVNQLEQAAEIFRKARSANTPVGIATSVGTPEQTVVFSDLGRFLEVDINMRSLVIIGNSTSRIIDSFFVTPRGYLS